jgi:hypothetical protein
MAMALPYGDSNVRIVIFYDRVQSVLRSVCVAPTAVFGHVLAHELGHVLEGVDRHSKTGVMKARWSKSDFDQMGKGPLEFAPEDVELILRGLATGERSNSEVLTAQALMAAPQL